MLSHSASIRVRRLGFALLLSAVPACGLSDYEALMHEAQEREERFNEEQKYLGELAQPPTKKTKDNQLVVVADFFFRPPKGIDSKPTQKSDIVWHFPPGALPPGAQASDFLAVDMAFAEEDKGFANKVVDSYQGGPRTQKTRQVTAPGQLLPLSFDVWEFNDGQRFYSANILKGHKPLGIVYIYKRAKIENILKAIDLSLQSLAVDPQVVLAARVRYQRRSPWTLDQQPGS